MTPANALDQLIDCQGALIHALDLGDVSAVAHATAQVAQVLDLVRHEHSAVHDDKGRFDYALRQAEIAHSRVNSLTDRMAQRLHRAAQRRGARVLETYKNVGKLSSA